MAEAKKLMFLSANFTVFFFLLIFIISSVAAEEGRGDRDKQYKLFVFGDSYADTGNWPQSTGAISWKEPYGITFPGQPSGRFSDGRVLTDYIASYLGIRSPVSLREWREVGEKSQLRYGINYAHGGTGVFNTMVNQPNLTTQINFFQQLIQEEGVFDTHDFTSSIALVSVAGNDYATFLAKNGNSEQDLPGFTDSIMKQIELNLERIHGLGVRKVGITAMEPTGCLPQMTVSSDYKNCTQTGNAMAKFHNQILQQTVEKLNNQSGKLVFQILDLYSAFMAALDLQNNNSGNSEVLKPCCVGSGGNGNICGSINNVGVKNYVVCENPKLSFFWDVIHPSHQGWFAIYSALKPSLQNLLH